MKFTLAALCATLLAYHAGYAQPPNAIAFEDKAFDQRFATGSIPVVTGRLLHYSQEDAAKATVSYSLVTLLGQVKKTATVAADGSFKLELEYPLPYQQIWLSVGDYFYTCLYANKDLHLEIDLQKLKASGKELYFNADGVRFLGTDGSLCAYMNDFILYRREEQQALNNRLHSIPRPAKPVAADVLATYGKVFDSLKMIKDDYAAKHPSPYGWLLENEHYSEFYGRLCVVYWGHTMEDALMSRINQHKTYLVSNSSGDYYRYLSTYHNMLVRRDVVVSWKDVADMPDLDKRELAAIDSMRTASTVPAAGPYTAENQLKWAKILDGRLQVALQTKLIEKGIKLLDSTYEPGKADLLKLLMNDSKDINEQRRALELLLPGMRMEWSRAVAKTTYHNTLAKIAAINKALSDTGRAVTAADFGKPLMKTGFGASLYKLSNVKGQDFLAALRKSFPGKAIVFDRWATWCAPCLSEMPHSKKLQEESGDLPVVFVYACTASGSNEDKWKTKVGELSLPGVHFFIDEALDAELSQYFSFTGYPGYAFIDRKGVYKPGAFKWVSEIKDKAALAKLVE